MENAKTSNKLYIGLIILFIIFVIGIIWVNSTKKSEEEYNFPSPKEVVEQYFTSWDNKDYVNTYATFSDGFKKIEPTAKSLQNFNDYVNTQNTDGVNIIDIKEINNDGQTASVDYNVEFVLGNGQKVPYEGTFTLKNRQGDIIQGWKLIHPYGENVDNN